MEQVARRYFTTESTEQINDTGIRTGDALSGSGKWEFADIVLNSAERKRRGCAWVGTSAY